MTVSLFGLGAALLAFWTVARFPAIGPQTVKSAVVVTVVILVLQTPTLRLVNPVLNDYGVPAALLAVVLPSLTVLFWACGCLVRSLVLLAAPYRR
jgi:hypothetical protein